MSQGVRLDEEWARAYEQAEAHLEPRRRLSCCWTDAMLVLGVVGCAALWALAIYGFIQIVR